MARSAWRRVTRFRRGGVGAGLLVFVLVMSAWEIGLVVGDHGTPVAVVACLGMTLPTLAAGRRPLTASLLLTASCALNNLGLGHLVRCGPFFLCLFYVVFQCARRPSIATKLGGLASALVAIEIQVRYDPVLGQDQLAFIAAVMSPFCVAGLLAGVRGQMIARLAARTRQLVAEREATATLAVAADREALSAALVDQLTVGLRHVHDLTCHETDVEPDLAAIEHHAREVMDQMRQAVRTVRAAHEPAEDVAHA